MLQFNSSRRPVYLLKAMHTQLLTSLFLRDQDLIQVDIPLQKDILSNQVMPDRLASSYRIYTRQICTTGYVKVIDGCRPSQKQMRRLPGLAARYYPCDTHVRSLGGRSYNHQSFQCSMTSLTILCMRELLWAWDYSYLGYMMLNTQDCAIGFAQEGLTILALY